MFRRLLYIFYSCFMALRWQVVGFPVSPQSTELALRWQVVGFPVSPQSTELALRWQVVGFPVCPQSTEPSNVGRSVIHTT